MRTLMLALFMWMALGAHAERAEAQYLDPYHYSGVVSGVNYGWGWWPVVVGPGFGYPYYGYNYYPYWNYQPRYATFGAIAYSVETGRWGVSYGYQTLRQAAWASEEYCGAFDCRPIVWAQGGCAAIAKGPESDRIGYGYHAERYRANRYALHSCRQGGNFDCQILAWMCTY